MKFKYKRSHFKNSTPEQDKRKLFPCASVYLSWLNQLITFILYQEPSPEAYIGAQDGTAWQEVVFHLFSSWSEAAFVYCDWRTFSQSSLPPIFVHWRR
jgi:hypothetical protein